MLVTLDIKNESKIDEFLNFIATIDYIDIKSKFQIPTKQKRQKNNLMEFAGMWQDRKIDINTLRQEAWKR